MMCGGLSNDVKEVDEEIKALCEQIKPDLAKKLDKADIEIEVIGYRTQVVAGTNYFVKMKVGAEYIHARIFKPLPHTNAGPELSAISRNQDQQADIAFFS